MTFSFYAILPELTALVFLLGMLSIEILKGENGSTSFPKTLSYAGGGFLILILAGLWGTTSGAFGGTFVLNPFSIFFKILVTLALLVTVFVSEKFFLHRPERTSEFYLVLWTCLMGMFVLVSAEDFLLLFIALEIMTLSFYIMAAYLKHSLISIEAGLKYLILGSLASGFLIFGIALLYLSSGTTSFSLTAQAFSAHASNRLLLLGLLFVISGLGFKVASAPFQLWVPDVYQGAPTPVVAFLSVASKSAAAAVLLKILFSVFPAFGARPLLFSVLAVLTLLYGNFSALMQSHMKRLFGYSSIGHAGYLLIGIAAGGLSGVSAVLYYLMAYLVTNLAAFTVINFIESELGSADISTFRGLARRAPFLAGCFFAALLSLAGVPPLAGFFAKFLILLAAVQQGLGWLALLGSLMVAVSLYYYLSVVRTMYLEEPEDPSCLSVSLTTKILLGILTAGIFLIGIFQKPFYGFALEAAKTLGLNT